MSISILITAYNTSNYIEQCLDSIQNQTYFKNNKNYEVLVGIDGCYETLKTLLQIRHKYNNLKIFISPINNGTYIMSNILINKANQNFKYNLRFDSDDIMLPNMVEEIINTNKDIVRFKFQQDNIISKYYAYGQIAYNKSILFSIGGYHIYNVSADADFILRIQKEYIIHHIDKPLFNKVDRSNSLVYNHITSIDSPYRNLCHTYYERYRQNNKFVENTNKECINLEELEMIFKQKHGYSINLDEPKTFNEKLWVRKLFQHDIDFVTYTDKVLSKQYTKDLPQLPYSVAQTFDDIQFDTDVVIKCNHGCMWHIYYINKEFYNNQYQKITKEEAKQYINEKLQIKYSSVFNPKFQWAYYYVQPMLLVEQFIGRNIGDIKLHIFKGQVAFIKYYKDRIGKTKIEIYDKDWIFQTNIHSWSKHELVSQSINKPQQLDYIIKWAGEHLQHIDYCRLDFLYKDDKLWFNEITLYHGNGLRKIEPYSFDLNLGKLWDLKINNTLVPNLHIPDIANDTLKDTTKGTTIIYKRYNINNDTR